MEIGLVRKVDIDHEMQQSYLDYAMSVIVARALPDARDGLKPVQRRILYAMYDMGLRSNSDFKKSARIVGEVLGKYHPHGDTAVYEAMARLAQDFSMRYPLVDGQGNFGSVDGDPPAAMRYTEARLTSFSMGLLSQIERDTVNFSPNFDSTLTEPDVLPAAAPNLLVNGASGIAVGMATNIPPHNLSEVVDALVYLLQQWEHQDDISVQDLMRFVKGPDFPTGGIILQESEQNDLLTAYATGRGRVMVRGRVHVEDMGRGKTRIIITELPYLTNKSSLIERIADLVREGVLEGIADLRDESDRQGMRIVIELNKAAETDPTLLKLYKHTPLQSTFGIIMLALVNGEPHLLSLKQALRVYLEHRLAVVKRRSEYDLNRAQQRAHILAGLRIAINNLDQVIAIIRGSTDVDQARTKLIKQYKLSDIQAQAILDMPLKRLASLERKKVEQEYKELLAMIKELEELLHSPAKMRHVVKTELEELKQNFGDRRRTYIVSLESGTTSQNLLTTTELTPARVVWVGVTSEGSIARTHNEDLPRVSGRQAPRWLIKTNTHQTLYLAAEDGRAASINVEELPEAEKFSDGAPLSKVLPFEDGENLQTVFTMPPKDEIKGDRFVLTLTRLGMIKKTAVNELPGPSTQRFILAKVNPGDSLNWALITDGESDILLVTARGMAIRFSEQELRPMGLVAVGVNGIKLAPGDQLIGVERLVNDGEIFLLASNGKAWRLVKDEFPVQGRYGQGVIAVRMLKNVELVGLMVGKKTQNGVVEFHRAAAKTIRLDDIPIGKRASTGQEALPVKDDDEIIGLIPTYDTLGIWESKTLSAVKKRVPRKVKPG
ncbi:MAG TPA: DNA gyrase subunit A [Anaerolineaceae bacterium]|nr:DNA gyrase subunit A [Anaerolineaceae bacterium]